jgi:uncharacterized protein YggE
MLFRYGIVFMALLAACVGGSAQQPTDLKLNIDPTNRTIAVSAQGRVTVDPDVAILHIGFETRPEDSKSAYADGARTSNAIVGVIKGAGIPDASIHSEFQRLEPIDVKNHKFKLTQRWTVKVPPPRAGDVLDLAVDAGATDSGDIEWTVEDVRALEDQALKQAAERARSDAGVMAMAAGAKLGSLLFATDQIAEIRASFEAYANDSIQFEKRRTEVLAPPLSIEPRKVVREATVYAVFAIQ